MSDICTTLSAVKTVTKRELNQRTAQVLAEVATGEAVLVTERGVPRWRIEAVETYPDAIARLTAEGRITAPKARRAPWPVDEPRYTPAEVDAVYVESRGDR